MGLSNSSEGEDVEITPVWPGPSFSFGIERNTKGFNYKLTVSNVPDAAMGSELAKQAVQCIKQAIDEANVAIAGMGSAMTGPHIG